MEETMQEGTAILAAPSNGNSAKRRLTAEDFGRTLLATEEVEVVGVGTVLIRSLTRAEQIEAYKQARTDDTDEATYQSLVISSGLVDPHLTADQVRSALDKWDGVSINTILQAIIRMSGMDPGFMREAVVRFQEGT